MQFRVIANGFFALSLLAVSVTFPTSASASPACEGRANKVYMFETSWCTWCRTARTFLDANGIDYDAFDIGQNRRARETLVRLTEQIGVPTFVVCDKVLQGYNETLLRYHLEMN